ncbi:MAG TPA: OB-fold domain-containing protein [Dehalococcoidia bacterium]|nr:OB-fold domain-containing protein [Dehalococcoidia bacterium]
MTELSATTEQLIPLREGMFDLPAKLGEPARLLGARCRECGQPFFPRRTFCAACTAGDLAPVTFASDGEVETYTIVRQQLPGSAMVPPYAIVRVRLDDGPSVQTVASGDPEAIVIGGRVRLIVERVKEDESGAMVVSFMATPVDR